jgi:hypothetical protein
MPFITTFSILLKLNFLVMKAIIKMTLSVLPVFIFFGAVAQQDEQEQNDNQVRQEQADQDQDRLEAMNQTQFHEYHDPLPFRGEDMEEALMTAGNLRQWDNSGDGRFDAAEFYVVLFHIWDRNHDGIIDSDEWEYGTNNFLSDYNRDEFGDFGDWDEDGNNELDVNEFARGIESAELYNASPRPETDGQRLEQEDADQMEQGVAPRQDDAKVEPQQDIDTEQQRDVTEQEQARTEQERVREGEYVEPNEAIVIWERRGVVEKIQIGDRTIELGSENVGHQENNDNNIDGR